jgi:tetratricopeptide (TPR) repeat protein
VTNDTQIDVELKRASRPFANGNYKKAESRYRRILSQWPDEVRAVVGLTRVDAELGTISNDEAIATVRGLAAAHSDNDRIPGALITMLVRMGRIEEAQDERRKFLDDFPHSPVALQVWANGMQVNPELKADPETQVTAWDYYKKALLSGPLLTPCFKSAAYYAAKRAEPQNSNQALKGSGFVERQALITRGLGPKVLSAVFVIGVVLAAITLHNEFPVSLTVQVLTLLWGLWCIYANNLMCCKKCRNAWIGLVGYFTLIGAIADNPRTWYVVAGLAALIVIWAALTNHLTLIFPTAKNVEKEDAPN